MPVVVDSIHCHLWTDALHVRELARNATNDWDRGTYVRLCVSVAWTALEVACQEVLRTPEIGHRFKDDLAAATAKRGLPPLDWSIGVWQRVRRLQELRKSYVHKFAALDQMFPQSAVADDAVVVVRAAIESLCQHVGTPTPTWLAFDEAHGWSGPKGVSDTAYAILTTGNASPKDPGVVKVCFVIDGREHTSSHHPAGTQYADEVARLIANVNVPISAVRVYEGEKLVVDRVVSMRGNK